MKYLFIGALCAVAVVGLLVLGYEQGKDEAVKEVTNITETLEEMYEDGGMLRLEPGVYQVDKPSWLSYVRTNENYWTAEGGHWANGEQWVKDDDCEILPENQFILYLFDSAERYEFNFTGNEDGIVEGTLILYYGEKK